MTQARAEATGIVEEGRRDAEVLRSRIEQEAREESERMVERAKREIQIARETAVKELYDLTGVLATSIASHIVGREIKAVTFHDLDQLTAFVGGADRHHRIQRRNVRPWFQGHGVNCSTRAGMAVRHHRASISPCRAQQHKSRLQSCAAPS